MIDPSQIGKRAWSYASVLQQAGLSCVEYVEQLTMLLFLKIADDLATALELFTRIAGKLPKARRGGGGTA